MQKYSLVWWYKTGATFRAQGAGNKRVARKFFAHLAYKLGYKHAEWIEDRRGDFERIKEAEAN